MNKSKSRGWQKRLGLILCIVCGIWVLNFFFGYYYDYGVKSDKCPIFAEQLDSYSKRGGYDFYSHVNMPDGSPDGFNIDVQHMTHPLAAPELFTSGISFQLDDNVKQEIIIKSVTFTHTTHDGHLIPFMHDDKQYSHTNKYLEPNNFPVNLSTNKSPRYLFTSQQYDSSFLPKNIKENIRMEMLIDGVPRVISGSCDLRLVKRYWKIEALMSI